MMGPGMMGGFGWGWFMPIGMILFWGLVIWGIVALVRGVATPGSSGSSRELDSALEVLKRRYARGEISKEEFEEKRKDLV
ncbi:MAG: SHOCT domain-containing protein [Chloroflexi bacterium]|nr:SHOCT domain-containing protein [Chloroflexota bacterium]MBM3154351.1 SHOCT domain-containing protein [Chloroflexota bacterium]MBM3174709.1 SHOCT domain-containing protein [Chloroflexota bacterium]MBM4449804.1 SHOCT domain-containing protein [Chloroflexota bacterium]